MPDVFTKAKRSDVMSRIHGYGNKETEITLLKLLRRAHVNGWRRHQPVFGKPDFVFREARVAVLVDGCFWHGCPKHCNTPMGNRAFWKKKLAANKARDRRVNHVLRKDGWCVVRIWAHDLAKRPAWCLSRIQRMLEPSRKQKGC